MPISRWRSWQNKANTFWLKANADTLKNTKRTWTPNDSKKYKNGRKNKIDR